MYTDTHETKSHYYIRKIMCILRCLGFLLSFRHDTTREKNDDVGGSC